MVLAGARARRAATLALLAGALVLRMSDGTVAAQSQPPDPSVGIARLLARLETVIVSGRPDLYLDLTSIDAVRERAQDAASALVGSGITRAAVRERDRAPLTPAPAGDAYRLAIEVFTERDARASITTWQMDIRLNRGGPDPDDWRIVDQVLLSTLDGLVKPLLDQAKQFRARNLVIKSDDIEIAVASGTMFVAETSEGPTVAVLLPSSGDRITFSPTPETERGQLRLFCKASVLQDRFRAVFIRINPREFSERFSQEALTAEAVDPAQLRKAEALFREDIGKSFNLDLADLSRDAWTFVPIPGDFLAELHTRKYGVLTYAKVSNEPEDITLFDRARRRNIAIYPSKARIESQGRFFDEDASAPYVIQRTDLSVTFDPDRFWIDGIARLRIRVRNGVINSFTMRLSEALTIRSVASPEFGRLIALRVKNQNSTVVTLPSFLMGGAEFTLLVSYSGRLVPPPPDRESVSPQGGQDPFGAQDDYKVSGEPHILYSTNSVWYPQAAVSGYAPTRMRLTVPAQFQILASGQLASGFPRPAPAVAGKAPAVEYEFDAPRPLRYLSCIISKFQPVASAVIQTTYAGGGDLGGIVLGVETNPRLQARGRDVLPVAEGILRFYRTLIGDAPYPAVTVGLVENETPGGHSPAYLSVLNEPLPSTPFNWGNDPAYFANFPEFFVAHELAHQWWGQAVGWRSYHERWISEGFSQYFAALYAKQLRGDATFSDLVRRMARWGKEESDHGPVSLGYRLGHIEGDSRIFRALCYNKAAVVLDMLRRRLGDEAFFNGVRRFYREWRFKKAGTDNVRRAFEAESGEDLADFFEGWIHGPAVPVVKAEWRPDPDDPTHAAVIRLDQVGPLLDYPVTVRLNYAGGKASNLLVKVRGRTTETRVVLEGRLRGIDVNPDGLTILSIAR